MSINVVHGSLIRPAFFKACLVPILMASDLTGWTTISLLDSQSLMSFKSEFKSCATTSSSEWAVRISVSSANKEASPFLHD